MKCIISFPYAWRQQPQHVSCRCDFSNKKTHRQFHNVFYLVQTSAHTIPALTTSNHHRGESPHESYYGLGYDTAHMLFFNSFVFFT